MADVIGKLEKQTQMGDFRKEQIAPTVLWLNRKAAACMLEGNQRCKDDWADSIMAMQAAHHQQMLHTCRAMQFGTTQTSELALKQSGYTHSG